MFLKPYYYKQKSLPVFSKKYKNLIAFLWFIIEFLHKIQDSAHKSDVHNSVNVQINVNEQNIHFTNIIAQNILLCNQLRTIDYFVDICSLL